ncbi:MAG: NAD(P)H-binding protein [Actinomycetospora sp.]|nr:NAD(P)H-binding protein [Actinomycetospora sp.]
MTIAITTPRGHVGSHVLRTLVAAGVRPRLLMRDPALLDPRWRDHVEVVRCDQDDGDAVLAATRGVEALLWISPSVPDADPVAAHARLGGHAARAVTENGIGRTVFLSSVGAEKRHGAGEIDGLARTEEALDASGAPVLHLRAGYFFSNLAMDLDGLREGVLRTAMALDRPMPWVDPRDIAEVAAARLLAPWTVGGVQAVHGPRDLTFAEVAEVLTGVLGRPVRTADDDVRAGLREVGLGEAQIEAIVGMSAGLREGFVAEQPRTLVTTTPSPLEGWAAAHLGPLR